MKSRLCTSNMPLKYVHSIGKKYSMQCRKCGNCTGGKLAVLTQAQLQLRRIFLVVIFVFKEIYFKCH